MLSLVWTMRTAMTDRPDKRRPECSSKQHLRKRACFIWKISLRCISGLNKHYIAVLDLKLHIQNRDSFHRRTIYFHRCWPQSPTCPKIYEVLGRKTFEVLHDSQWDCEWKGLYMSKFSSPCLLRIKMKSSTEGAKRKTFIFSFLCGCTGNGHVQHTGSKCPGSCNIYYHVHLGLTTSNYGIQ